jgi:hypothetical protein
MSTELPASLTQMAEMVRQTATATRRPGYQKAVHRVQGFVAGAGLIFAIDVAQLSKEVSLPGAVPLRVVPAAPSTVARADLGGVGSSHCVGYSLVLSATARLMPEDAVECSGSRSGFRADLTEAWG